MSRIEENVIESVRKGNDIVDFVGEYVQLKKQGRNYFGLCPFHQENSPSFSVSEEKQIFHCFGCGKGGNVITFLMEIDGMPFHEAVTFLANKSGIDLPKSSMPNEIEVSPHEKSALLASEWLTKLYHHLLKHAKDGKDGLEYIINRGIKNESIETFQLGYASTTKDFTADFLEKKGFSRQELLDSGLLNKGSDDSLLDRFSGRLIFPIRNHIGKTIAFGGRSINHLEPKYLNSPESDLFKKSRILYNFDIAKKHIRKQNEAVLCEGYMDVIACDQAGVHNSVATLGTALSEYQAALLKRYVDTVIICYDADDAGQKATYKAAVTLRKAGCNVKIAKMPDTFDPDGFILKYGADRFKNEVIQASDTFMSFYMRYIKKDYNLSRESDQLQYIENVIQQLAMIDSPIEREYYLKELAESFDITYETLVKEVEAKRNNTNKRENLTPTNSQNQVQRSIKSKDHLRQAYQNAERTLIAYMLQDMTIANKVREELGARFNLETHQVIVTYLYAFHEDGGDDIADFLERLPNDQIKQLVSEIAMIEKEQEITDPQMNDYIRTIQSKTYDSESVQSLREQQKLFEQQNDPIKAAQIAMQIIELQKQNKLSN